MYNTNIIIDRITHFRISILYLHYYDITFDKRNEYSGSTLVEDRKTTMRKEMVYRRQNIQYKSSLCESLYLYYTTLYNIKDNQYSITLQNEYHVRYTTVTIFVLT